MPGTHRITELEAASIISAIRDAQPHVSVIFVNGTYGQWLRYDWVSGGRYITRWEPIKAQEYYS